MAAGRQPGGRGGEDTEPVLRVPRSRLDAEIGRQLELGQELLDRDPHIAAEVDQLRSDFYTWDEFNQQLFRNRFSTGKVANEYRMIPIGFGGGDNLAQKLNWTRRDITSQGRKLESIRQRLDLYDSPAEEAGANGLLGSPPRGTKVFVVHGHDGSVKLEVAEFIQKITGKRPVILHEQADYSRTTIEKFEAHAAEAGFAVVLLTADDVGGAKGAEMRPRARQNVVLELGFFFGALGRSRVVVLYEDGVELPSDITGVLYKPLSGNWHTELARELDAAGIDIDFNKLFK